MRGTDGGRSEANLGCRACFPRSWSDAQTRGSVMSSAAATGALSSQRTETGRGGLHLLASLREHHRHLCGPPWSISRAGSGVVQELRGAVCELLQFPVAILLGVSSCECR